VVIGGATHVPGGRNAVESTSWTGRLIFYAVLSMSLFGFMIIGTLGSLAAFMFVVGAAGFAGVAFAVAARSDLVIPGLARSSPRTTAAVARVPALVVPPPVLSGVVAVPPPLPASASASVSVPVPVPDAAAVCWRRVLWHAFWGGLLTGPVFLACCYMLSGPRALADFPLIWRVLFCLAPVGLGFTVLYSGIRVWLRALALVLFVVVLPVTVVSRFYPVPLLGPVSWGTVAVGYPVKLTGLVRGTAGSVRPSLRPTDRSNAAAVLPRSLTEPFGYPPHITLPQLCSTQDPPDPEGLRTFLLELYRSGLLHASGHVAVLRNWLQPSVTDDNFGTLVTMLCSESPSGKGADHFFLIHGLIVNGAVRVGPEPAFANPCRISSKPPNRLELKYHNLGKHQQAPQNNQYQMCKLSQILELKSLLSKL